MPNSVLSRNIVVGSFFFNFRNSGHFSITCFSEYCFESMMLRLSPAFAVAVRYNPRVLTSRYGYAQSAIRMLSGTVPNVKVSQFDRIQIGFASDEIFFRVYSIVGSVIQTLQNQLHY